MKLIPMTAVLAVCGVFVPVAALAQAAPATGNAPRTTTSNAEELEEVVVSTRIVRDGYKAPTPTSVLGLEEIQASAPKNIADLVNQLPSFAGSNTPSLTTGWPPGTTSSVVRVACPFPIRRSPNSARPVCRCIAFASRCRR